MGRAAVLLLLPSLLAAGPIAPPSPGEPGPEASAPTLARTFRLEGVRGPADRTGIPGRIDHVACDPATGRLFVACVANGSLEVIDLNTGARAGTIAGLREPQGVAVAGGSILVTTGGDGEVHRFDARTLAAGGSARVGDDADNVRPARDGALWVSHLGGLARLDARTLALDRSLPLPRMPEGFQLAPDGVAIFANLPAGKRSSADGTVIALRRPGGEPLWERRLLGRAGNFPLALDPSHDRLFVVARNPPRLIALSARDGSVLGEAPCPPESDDLLFDARSGLVAVIGGGVLPTPPDPGGTGASLDLFVVDASGRPSRSGGTPLPPHTRTGTLAADRRTIYVASPAAGDRPAEVREYRLPD